MGLLTGLACPLGATSCFFFVVIVLIFYILWDVHYFIRIITTIGFARFFGAKIKVFNVSKIKGYCTTNDVDIFLRHMNNARYVRELDFARFDYYERTGLYEKITKDKGFAMQSASLIRYRRSIAIFTSYHITTKLIWWDEKALYLEQQFVTADGFVRAVVLSKQSVILPKNGEYGGDFNKLMEHICHRDRVSPVKPDRPPELEHMCECIDISSAKLRKAD